MLAVVYIVTAARRDRGWPGSREKLKDGSAVPKESSASPSNSSENTVILQYFQMKAIYPIILKLLLHACSFQRQGLVLKKDEQQNQTQRLGGRTHLWITNLSITINWLSSVLEGRVTCEFQCPLNSIRQNLFNVFVYHPTVLKLNSKWNSIMRVITKIFSWEPTTL